MEDTLSGLELQLLQDPPALKIILFKPWEGGHQIVILGISEHLLIVCTKPS